jgi:hypothetical protein
MWEATKHMALNDDPCAPKLSLIAEPSSTTAHAQIDAKWLTTESLQYMTPSKFSTALSIRLGVIPSHLSLRGTKCNCGVIYDADEDSIEHILTV